jgi:hypothetical protein
VIKTGSKERRKKAESGERNEQENKPETLIGSVFQGMLKGFVWVFFGGGFSAFFGRFGFHFLFSRLWQFFLRPLFLFCACTASVFYWCGFPLQADKSHSYFCALFFAAPSERDDFVFCALFTAPP